MGGAREGGSHGGVEKKRDAKERTSINFMHAPVHVLATSPPFMTL